MKTTFLWIAIVAFWISSPAAGAQQPQVPGILRGIVVNDITNEPIPGVRISIGKGNANALLLESSAQAALNKNARDSEAESRLLQMTADSLAGTDTGRDFNTVTDKDGRFSFDAIRSGDYPVSAVREGYVGVDIRDALKAPSVSRITTTVAPGQTTEIVLKMIPAAVVSGRIVDPNGNVLSKATVEVLIRIDKDGIPSAEQFSQRISNDRGEFRVFQLPPGEYILSATPGPAVPQRSESGVRTYYPNAADLSEATPLKLRTGEEVGGINIQIRTARPQN